MQVLQEIDAADRPMLDVYNKSDLVRSNACHTKPGKESIQPLWVSASTGAGMDLLREAIGRRIGVAQSAVKVLLSPQAGRTRSWLYGLGAVMEETTLSDGHMQLTVRLTQGSIARLQREPGVMLQSSQVLG